MDTELLIRIASTIVGIILAFIILRIILNKITAKLASRIHESSLKVFRFFAFYVIYIFLITIILNFAGFNIAALLGAAGVASIVIGFAAQTTVANIISGIFIIMEQSLRIGDTIVCDNTQGKIKEFGLLSVTLRTIDNKIIRIPNDSLIKKTVINLTRMSERRLTFHLSVEKNQNSSEIEKLIMNTWEKSSFTIKDKQATISYNAVSANMVGLSIDLWVKTADIISAQSDFIEILNQQASQVNTPIYITRT